MKSYPLRSIVFTASFYGVTALACLICLPGMFLPRKQFLNIVVGWLEAVYWLERHIMRLDYEVRGAEHLPASDPYIVAAKHQSAYETMKLHILFRDPAIILKKELLSIPIWGQFVKKSDVIAIDRSSPEAAIASIQAGAIRMKEQGRPIIIFPQGTRVPVDMSAEQKPYKVGVARIQDATNLPIVPMALNTGYFWPKRGLLKRPGRVIFEFLPAIEPGMERGNLLAKITNDVESASQALLHEAIECEKNMISLPAAFVWGVSALLLFAIYTATWFALAGEVKKQYYNLHLTARIEGPVERHIEGLHIGGYPGPITITADQDYLTSPKFNLELNNLKAWAWPIPFVPAAIEAESVTYKSFEYEKPFVTNNVSARFTVWTGSVVIHSLKLTKDAFEANGEGSYRFDTNPPGLDLDVAVKNSAQLIGMLAADGFIEQKPAMFAAAAFAGLQDAEGVAHVKLSLDNNALYAGPFLIRKF